MRHLAATLWLAICAFADPARATADGHDFFRVAGTHGYPLNIRAAANAEAEPIGAIPAEATGLRNLGCTGGLSMAAYLSASPEQRQQARFTRWCKVAYKGKIGWVAGWFLAEALAPVKPSFDCTLARSSAEKRVCADAALAGLDNELARLFRLAEAGPDMTDARLRHFKAYQRGWIKGRDDCWKDRNGLDGCVIGEYATRIHEIRAVYPAARGRSGEGISLGPFVYRCDGMDGLVSTVFVKGKAALVSLHWDGQWRTLRQVISGSGARYGAAESRSGDDEFWIKGAEARFTRAGQPATTCRTEATN